MDTMSAHWRAWTDVTRELGLTITPEQFLGFAGRPTSGIFASLCEEQVRQTRGLGLEGWQFDEGTNLPTTGWVIPQPGALCAPYVRLPAVDVLLLQSCTRQTLSMQPGRHPFSNQALSTPPASPNPCSLHRARRSTSLLRLS